MVLKIKDLIGIDHKVNEFIEDLSDEDSSKIIGGAGDISEQQGDIEKEIEPFESMSSGTEDPTGICEVTDPSGGCLIV